MSFVKEEIVIDSEQLVEGKRYKVTLSDCCVEGEFEAQFITKDEEDNLYFGNGVVLGTYWGAYFERVDRV